MTRKYIKVNEDQRAQLAALCNEGLTIKQASDNTAIPYENAKAIIRVMRKQELKRKQAVLSISVHKISKSSKQANLTILNEKKRTNPNDSPLQNSNISNDTSVLENGQIAQMRQQPTDVDTAHKLDTLIKPQKHSHNVPAEKIFDSKSKQDSKSEIQLSKLQNLKGILKQSFDHDNSKVQSTELFDKPQNPEKGVEDPKLPSPRSRNIESVAIEQNLDYLIIEQPLPDHQMFQMFYDVEALKGGARYQRDRQQLDSIRSLKSERRLAPTKSLVDSATKANIVLNGDVRPFKSIYQKEHLDEISYFDSDLESCDLSINDCLFQNSCPGQSYYTAPGRPRDQLGQNVRKHGLAHNMGMLLGSEQQVMDYMANYDFQYRYNSM